MNSIAHTAEEANSYLKSSLDMLPLDLIGIVNDTKQQKISKRIQRHYNIKYQLMLYSNSLGRILKSMNLTRE